MNNLDSINSYQKQIRITIGKDPKPIININNFKFIKKLKDFDFGHVGFADAKSFIEKYEWLGYLGRGRIFYGIWKDNYLYGVVVFCPLPLLAAKVFPTEIRNKILYLSRGACCFEAGKNAGSMLIGHSLRDLKNKDYWMVLAYSDTNAGEGGYIYKASNFIYAGETTSKGTVYVKISGKWYSPKSLYNTFKISNYKDLPNNIIIEEIKKDSTNKKRWIYILSDYIIKYIPKTWNININE